MVTSDHSPEPPSGALNSPELISGALNSPEPISLALDSETKVALGLHTAMDPASAGCGEAGSGSRKVFSNRYLHRLQQRHFLLFNTLPFLAFLSALALLPFYPPTIAALLCFALLWALTEFCIVAGYHRLFAHRSYKASRGLRILLHLGAMMGAQGGLVSWVALHRRHHEFSDKEGDPHSPQPRRERGRLRSIIHAQFTWMYRHDYPNVMHYAPDLAKDPLVLRLDQYYFHVVIAGILLPGLIAFAFEPNAIAFANGVLWGGLVRIFALGQSIGAVNALLHSFGQRRFATGDNSRNSALFSLLTFGDSWHNNHHAFPRSASAGLEWYRPDPAFWIIKSFERLGLTWDVYVPSATMILQRTRELKHIAPGESNSTADNRAPQKIHESA